MVKWERALADAQTKQADPLAGLIDIPLPQEVSLWPQTWLLRIAILLVAVLTVLAIWRFVHRYRANRYRREALSELDRMRQTSDAAPDCLAAQLALLVRRTALGVFPRETVAPLTGTAWLAFLDRSYGGDEFSRGVGRWLVSAPYQQTAPGRDELNALRGLVDRWIRVHHV
jgi:Ca-activated chloride channel family protein